MNMFEDMAKVRKLALKRELEFAAILRNHLRLFHRKKS